MDFSWNENQKELKKTATKFAESKLNDGIIEKDRKSEFSQVGWKACSDFGLQGMLIPIAYGGSGVDTFDIVAILEGIGYGCRDNGLIFSINAHIWGCEIPIYHFGTEEQKQRNLPDLCKGKFLGAVAMTEPDTGSDIYALRTTVAKEKDYYILNGNKMFITNAPIANIFIVYARTTNFKGLSGISCFLVEKGMEGFILGEPFKKMGLKTSPMSDLAFNNCKIPRKNLIGNEGAGSIIFNDSMVWERIFILANCIGVMERLFDICVEYVKVRKLGNGPIGKYQSIANKIAEMKIRLEASRFLLYRAAWLKSNKKTAVMESAMAKLYVSESYVQNCRDAIQIYGGYGYGVEYELERELRDAMASTIYSGTSEIQKNIIARLSGL